MSKLAAALDAVLADIAFTPPVSVDDCAQLRDALRDVLPKGTRLEVYCHKDDVVVVRAESLTRELVVT